MTRRLFPILLLLAPLALAVVETYPSGKKKAEGALKNGQRDGIWHGFFESGKKMYVRHYSEGVKQANWLEWYEDGQLRSEINYKDDALHGKKAEWWENGQLRREWLYEDGKPKDGTEVVRHANGKLLTEYRWKNGHGADFVQTAYYDDGQRWYHGAWKHELQHGKWTAWHRNGKVARITTYKKGQATLVKEYDEAGKLIRTQKRK